MSKLLAAIMLFFSTYTFASSGYFLIQDKKAGLRIRQELFSFLDYQADFLANKYNFENSQSINFYLPNETKLGLCFSFESKLKERDKAGYNYYLAAETKLW
jgi:hypothetical protein